MKNKTKVKIKQYVWDNGFQTWVKRLFFYNDKELSRLQDQSIGFYHCEQCDDWKGFALKVPKDTNEVSKEAKNEWIDFLTAHAHGDGRVVLFERKI